LAFRYFTEKKNKIAMSEFTNHQDARVAGLTQLFQLLIENRFIPEQLPLYQQIIEQTRPFDVILVVDRLVQLQVPMPELKKGINKAMNLINKSLQEFPYQQPHPGSFLDTLIQNNRQIEQRLKNIRPDLKQINQEPGNSLVRENLQAKLTDLTQINLYYQIKENVLFPAIEKYMPDYRCLSVMWSFHDDIRRNLKEAIRLLDDPDFDLKKFNRLAGDLFFNIYAIKFREERILFPVISEIISEETLDSLLDDALEIGFPFFQHERQIEKAVRPGIRFADEVNLKTGCLSAEQIMLIFNHLPVDITYVDENNRVKYFSTPEKRIFRRTNSIIGRDVKNCHPHESVHVVEQIVEAFRKGEKNQASFWIQMKNEMVLIQYFAVRDEADNYRGVIEVSQEISEIRQLQGEKRLLDWE
jgi:DUF438 domain-containing protein